jgi:hypothetical protein
MDFKTGNPNLWMPVYIEEPKIGFLHYFTEGERFYDPFLIPSYFLHFLLFYLMVFL